MKKRVGNLLLVVGLLLGVADDVAQVVSWFFDDSRERGFLLASWIVWGEETVVIVEGFFVLETFLKCELL